MTYSDGAWTLDNDDARRVADATWTQPAPPPASDEGDCIALGEADLFDVESAR